MISIRRVVGGSMRPTFMERQLVVAIRWRPRLGSVVIARADGREVIKRVVLVDNKKYHLVGDHPASSAYSVEPSDVLGVVVWPRRSGKSR